MLTIEGLAFSRGAFSLRADLEVSAGVTAVIGPSGGGKSTFLSLIAGFEVEEAGRLVCQSVEFGGLAPGKRPVAMLFQDNNLFPHLDVLTNVALGASAVARPSEAVLTRAREALAQVGLDGFGGRKPSELSGGQQSRAALARVLLTERPIVLMDEAFSALGPALKAEMLELTASLMPGKCILMVTHDPEDAKRYAGATILVSDGLVAAPVETGALFADPPEALARYLA